jgi:hypothetical protein
MSPDYELLGRIQSATTEADRALEIFPVVYATTPAGIPPASNNPLLQKAAQELLAKAMAIITAIMTIGPPSPVVPTPPPPSPTP